MGKFVLVGFLLLALGTRQAAAGEAVVGCGRLPSLSSLVALDEETRATRRLSAHLDLRDLALFSYRHVASDVLNGRGPYLDAMTHGFRGVCADGAVVRAWLLELIVGSDSVADFARRIALARTVAGREDGMPAASPVATAP